MTLKEQMQEDVSTFLNLDEFAEECELYFTAEDGSNIGITLPVLRADNGLTFSDSAEPGLGLVSENLCVATAQIPDFLGNGKNLELNGESYAIVKRSDAGGITTFEIVRRQYQLY